MLQNNTKRWINTKVEYQWDDALGKLVQLSKEGYWYEGDMALCVIAHADFVTIKKSGNANHPTGMTDPNMVLELYPVNNASSIVINLHNTSTDANMNFAVDNTVQGGMGYLVSSGRLQLKGSSGEKISILGNYVGIGTTVPTAMLDVYQTADASDMQITNSGNDCSLGVTSYRASAGQSTLAGQFGRGTKGSPTVVLDGDMILQIYGAGYDGNSFAKAALIAFEVDGTPGDGDMPGRLIFKTSTDGGESLVEQMRITNAGNVGIGDSSPSYKLEVTGTFYSSGSSIEYKQDIEPYSPPEGAIMSLKPIQYQYKDEWKVLGKRYAGNSSKQLGLVAEDVAKVFPELAITKREDGKEVVRNVDYEKLTVLLVSEVQKLRTELDEIKNN